MKIYFFFIIVMQLLFTTAAFAETSAGDDTILVNWNLLWSGYWDPSSGENMLTSGNLHNRGEFKLGVFLPKTKGFGFTMRGQVLDRRPFSFEFDTLKNWFDNQDFSKAVTHFQGALYHNTTGSRLLYGALDEWGLSARIRNPWIRSPPYAENHKPLIGDLKTAASSAKEDEVYIYLSTPFLSISPDFKARGFISMQTEVFTDTPEYNQTAASAGLEFNFPDKSNLLFETFYTWATLPQTAGSSWFSDPPPLPERDFHLFAAGFLFSNPFLLVSSDFAMSETFVWGSSFYGNLGISLLFPVSLLPWWNTGRIERPLSISLAFDGAGNRFVYRDGLDHGAGFRTALKIELKGARNALMRLSTTLRAREFPFLGGNESGWQGFNRSSINFYLRLPAIRSDSSLFSLSRISISMDRNADNPQKIIDRLYGYAGFSLNLSRFGIKTPLGIVLNGSIRGTTEADGILIPYPFPVNPWNFEDCSIYTELSFSPSIYQFKLRFGYSNDVKNREIWDFSASGAVRFKSGRLSLKISSPGLPDMWNFNISWRMELN